ncbi:titin homolog isoform X5 [Hippocampus zosterae]|uniref:titin homolog isoform X5 n=1 Tax=Hippocampus zosterae TaxID=109293 RepID=UPI00223D549B|nr:titin homolog isoform X5 [Hippocampus zosterae]
MEKMKPEAKKKKPSKLPPWPPEPQRIDAEKLDKPTPVVPPRPKHNELSHTQYRLKRLEMDGEASRNMTQSETKEKKPETPVPAPRRAEKERNWTPRHSRRKSDHKQISAGSVQSDAATDTKQTRPSVLTAKVRRSLKVKKMSFISHVTDNQDRGDDAPDKKTTSIKPGVLKGVMKHLKSTSKVGGGSGGDLDPDKEAAEKERMDGNKVKQDKSAESKQDESMEKMMSASNEDLSGKAEKDRGLFGVFLKKSHKGERADSPDSEEDKEQVTTKAVGGDDVADRGIPKDKNLFSNMFKKPQKPTEGDKEALVKSEVAASGSLENLSENVPKVKKGGLAGIFRRSNSQDNLLDEGKSIFSGMFKKTPKAGDEASNGDEEKKLLSASNENLTEENAPKEKMGGLAGILKKSPKTAPRSLATKDPHSDGNQEESIKDDLSGDELAGPPVDLEAATAKEKKGGFTAMFKRMPKTADKHDNDKDEEAAPSVGGGLKRRRTIKKKRRVVSFRVKTTLPKMPKLNESSQAQEKMPVIEESLEMQEMIPAQSTFEIQPVELAAYPTGGNPLESEEVCVRRHHPHPHQHNMTT